MTKILLTAFEPYDQWSENSSWLTLVELTKHRDFSGKVATRRYPVDLHAVLKRLQQDMAAEYDYVIHLGQSPGAVDFKIEAFALNTDSHGNPLASDAPSAYRTDLPLKKWAETLRTRGIPASVSYHAGTYLCNAIFYLSQHVATVNRYPTKSAFIHLPLTPQQACGSPMQLASLSLPMLAAGVSTILDLVFEADTLPNLV